MIFIKFSQEPFKTAVAVSLFFHLTLFVFISTFFSHQDSPSTGRVETLRVSLLALSPESFLQNESVPLTPSPLLEPAAPEEPEGSLEKIEFTPELVQEVAPVLKRDEVLERNDQIKTEEISSPPSPSSIPQVSHSESGLNPSAPEREEGSESQGVEFDSLVFEEARIPAPAYPPKAKQMGWEGDITVSFIINSRGRTEEITVESSSGHEVLDQAVLRVVKRGWRFPRREEPLRVWKTFSFRLL